MSLRRKLLTVFGGLAILTLVVAGMTLWVMTQWRGSEDSLRSHYQRSLKLQGVRATTFLALKELPDAVTGADRNAREQFEKLLKPAEEDFATWASLADSEEERNEVQLVRSAYDAIVRDAVSVFDLAESGRTNEALALLEERLKNHDFLSFQNSTERAVISDQEKREVIRAQVTNTRRTAQIVLAIAAFGTISLTLLLAAYLYSDLFAPLREAELALQAVALGDLEHRLNEERADEIGAINRAFNRMSEAIFEREQVAGLAAIPIHGTAGSADRMDFQNTTSRLMLHRLVSKLRSQVSELSSGKSNGKGEFTVRQKEELIEELDHLLHAVSRVTEFGFPLDLNLARTDIRALLYEVLLRFHDRFVQRGINLELDVAPEVSHAVIDRLKLRSAIGELIRNAVSALPEHGGRIGIRSSVAADEAALVIEVADNGAGAEMPLINQAFTTFQKGYGKEPAVGLALTNAIVKQHGGDLSILSEHGQGTHVRIKLPLLD